MMGLVLLMVTFIIALSGLIYYYFTRNYNYWRDRNVPYPKPRFFFGNIIELCFGESSPGESIIRLFNQFQTPYFGIFLLNQPVLVIRDSDIAKNILITDFNIFTNHVVDCDDTVDPNFSKALPSLKGDEWKAIRAKLSPAFSPSKIKLMFGLINQCAKNMAEHLSTKDEKNEIEIRSTISKYIVDVVISCVFGTESNSFTDGNTEIIKAARQIFERSFFGTLQTACYFIAPSLVKPLKPKFIDPKAASVLKKLLTKVLHQRETLKIQRMDFLDILMVLKNKETADDVYKFDSDSLMAQAVTFFAVGHEAGTLTASYALHELCLNNHMQEKLRSEIVQIIEYHQGLTYEAVQDMKYLDRIVAEVLRKYPLAPFLQRQAAIDYKIPQTGLVIEKGTPILIPIHGLHWSPQYFSNPHVFDPERYTYENIKKITSGSYMPFGLGPRSCIAEKMGLVIVKLAIIYVIWQFKITKNKEDDLKYKSTSGILHPNGALNMTYKII